MKRRDFVVGAVAGAVGAGLGVAGRSAYPKAAPRPADSRLSFSQQGEDIVLWHVARDILRMERPSYVDVGAAEPIKSNNTYLLYGTGGRGVLVEPNPTFVEKLRSQRPRDTVVAAGIGVTQTGEADYYVIKGNPMLNTFSPEQVEYHKRERGADAVERVLKMPLITLNDVIREYLGAAPDVLSTDIEGWDYDILRSLDFDRFRPGAICAETVPVNGKGEHSQITAFLLSKGYVIRGGSLINSIYVDAARI
jgi:FkbM family methyltransferase